MANNEPEIIAVSKNECELCMLVGVSISVLRKLKDDHDQLEAHVRRP